MIKCNHPSSDLHTTNGDSPRAKSAQGPKTANCHGRIGE